jgi:hypothetical protein
LGLDLHRGALRGRLTPRGGRAAVPTAGKPIQEVWRIRDEIAARVDELIADLLWSRSLHVVTGL